MKMTAAAWVLPQAQQLYDALERAGKKDEKLKCMMVKAHRDKDAQACELDGIFFDSFGLLAFYPLADLEKRLEKHGLSVSG